MPNEARITVALAEEANRILDAHMALLKRTGRLIMELEAAQDVIAAARAVYNGASVETRRAALERLGAALERYDNGA